LRRGGGGGGGGGGGEEVVGILFLWVGHLSSNGDLAC